MFEFLKLLPLTGRMADCWFTQGDCPGLGASALSGRAGWTYATPHLKTPTITSYSSAPC